MHAQILFCCTIGDSVVIKAEPVSPCLEQERENGVNKEEAKDPSEEQLGERIKFPVLYCLLYNM